MHSVRAHVTFEAAHRLHDDGVYSKKCQTCLHGHSYGVTVYLSSPRLLDCGMVIDFTQLKEILRSVIVEPFDHSCILKKTDPLCMPVSMYCENVHIVDENPTAEWMAHEFYLRVQSAIASKLADTHPQVKVTRVEVQETANNIAIFEVGHEDF